MSDYTKINAAFEILRARGYETIEGTICCGGCAVASFPEGTTKAVYYTEQDAEAFNESGDLWEAMYLGWGGDASEIVQELRLAGFDVELPASEAVRIELTLPFYASKPYYPGCLRDGVWERQGDEEEWEEEELEADESEDEDEE